MNYRDCRMEKKKKGHKRHSSEPLASSSKHKRPETEKPKLSNLDIKIDQLFRSVYCQKGVRADLLLINTGVGGVLQNAVNRIKRKLKIKKGFHPNEYLLAIDDEVITEGIYPSKALARVELSKIALDILKKDCFYLVKKSPVYEEVPLHQTYSKSDLIEIQDKETNTESGENRLQDQGNKDELDSHILEGSKAHRMMLKMGWSGKGLGNNEQGTLSPIEVEVREKRQGLGSSKTKNEPTNKKKQIDDYIVKILEDFIHSSKTTTLSFDTGYTKEERERIHAIARRLDLKSKSTGKGDSRRITISRKVEDYHLLIAKLLRSGLEDDNYSLEIPSNFLYLFQ